MTDKYIKKYKRENKALQRRISIEKDVNKRLLLLLEQTVNNLNSNLLKESIEHELKMSKYKYY